MNIFLSGIRGFLGSHLARHLRERGHRIAGSTSRPDGAAAETESVVTWRFVDPVQSRWLEGIDVVVHCAHDFAAGIDVNLRGTMALAMAARQAGVRKQLFISSLSSRPDAGTRYGQTKFAIEQALAGDDLLIVRPGTIVGSGGLFGRMCQVMRTLPVIPLIGGGTDRMHLIGAADACLAVGRVLERDPPAAFNLYYEETPPIRDVLFRVKRLMNSRSLLVPVPRGVVAVVLGVADRIGVRLPVDRDNLRGLEQSQKKVHGTDLPSLLEAPQSVDEALDAMFHH